MGKEDIAIVGKNTAIFSITSFITDLSSEMIFPLLPLFLVTSLQATGFEIGIIEGVAFGIIGLFSLFSLYFINKLGNEKKVAIFGYGLSSATKIGFSLAGNWIQVLLFRSVERIGKGVRIVARDTLITLSENKKRLGIAFGIRQSMDVLGQVLGPLIAAMLLYTMSNLSNEQAYRNVFLIAAVISMLSLPLLLFIKQEGKPKNTPLSEIKKYMFAKEHRGILTLIAIMFFANFSIAFFILRASEFLQYYMVPIAYLGFSAMFSVFCIPTGIIADRVGIKKILVCGLVIYLLSLIIFAYFPSLQNIFLGFMLLGIFSAILEINAKILATRTGDGERYDVIFGTYHAVSRIVKLPSNIIAGFLWAFPFFGAPSTFAFGIFVTIIAIASLSRIKG